MIKLAHPEALYLLGALLPLGGLFVLFMMGRRRALARFGENSLLAQLTPNRPTFKHQIKFILLALSWIFLVLALANPQIGRSYEKVKREGADLMIALDISKSMLAEDQKPSRLAKAQQFISSLLDRLSGDRVGLIIFAGNAYLQVPITSDYLATKTVLKTINTDLASTQGTAIGEAIRVANEALDHDEHPFKTMLIISDGEDHEGEAMQAAEAAIANGMIIHTMGVGSTKGAPIPEYRGGRKVGNKKDRNGSIVFSKLNEPMLQEVAAAGQGEYFRLENGNSEINAFLGALSKMEKQEFDEHTFADYEDQFQWFLAIGLLLLGLEYFISERRSHIFSDWKIFQTPTSGE